MAAEDYVGPPGHEKKFHKTHFQATQTLKLRTTRPSKYEWVEIAPGRFIRKAKDDGKEKRKS
jgi:hypothetical protein